MKVMSLLLALLVSQSVFAQDCVRKIDISSDSNSLKFRAFAIHCMKLIEKSNIDELNKYISDDNELDMKEVRQKAELVRERFAGDMIGYPGMLHLEDKVLSYERTYYDCDENKRAYYYQVEIFGIENGEDYVIIDIQFREGEEIQRRDFALDYLKKVGPGVPPPAPPPPPKFDFDKD